MESIKEIIPRATAQLARPTKAAVISINVSARFAEFQTLGDPQLERMKSAAMQFVADMLANKRPRWLSLLGTSGAGKTMLTKIIAKTFRQVLSGTVWYRTPAQFKYRDGGFITWNKLANLLREGSYRVFDDVCDDWFVALDDIGSEQPSAFVNAKLFEFMNRGENKWRVITGNLSLAQIGDRIDMRIASRMLRNGSVVVDVEVQDFNAREG